jgi:2-oxopent-4-enoate/cis-2-oxohex-4-enoate hydratase
MDDRVRHGMAAQLALRDRRLNEGETPVGWKVGLNPPAAQERAGIDGPVAGFLASGTVAENGAVHRLEGGVHTAVEPELFVALGADVPAGASPENALAAVAAAGPALEIVAPDRDVAEIEAVLAGDIFHRAVVFGPQGPLPSGPLPFRVLVDGEPQDEGEARKAIGDLGGLLAHVAAFLGVHGAALRAGERVICGTLVPALPARAGGRVELELDALGSVEAAFDE